MGTILERDGSTYRVAAPGREIRAILRGKAKRETPRVVVGDRVRLEPEAEGEVFGIVGVEPRTTLLERRVPEGRGTRPVAANIDEVFVVTATVDPAPIPQLIDRLLAERFEPSSGVRRSERPPASLWAIGCGSSLRPKERSSA